MSTKKLPSHNTGSPEGDNRDTKKGMMKVRYIGHDPEIYVPAGGITFEFKKDEVKEIPANIGSSLIKQEKFQEEK